MTRLMLSQRSKTRKPSSIESPRFKRSAEPISIRASKMAHDGPGCQRRADQAHHCAVGRAERGRRSSRHRASAINDAGMTLTTVAIGEDADFATMRILRRHGRRAILLCADRPTTCRASSPREAFLASRSTIIEEPFTPRLVRPAQATDGIDWSSAPQLGGYVGTAERDSLQIARHHVARF